MKRACLAALICWSLPTAAFAAPCVPGSLASYLALGSAGCTIGPATFFNFANLPLQGGAAAIADSSALVTPVNDPFRPGLTFNVNSEAQAGNFQQRVIGFSVGGFSIIGNQINLGGSAVTPDGAVIVAEDKCLGGVFALGSTGCTTTEMSAVAFDLGPLDRSLSESLQFAPTSSVGVVLDISVDGGLEGSASLRSATAQFTAVPEPATLALVGVGLAAAAGRRRRSRIRAQTGNRCIVQKRPMSAIAAEPGNTTSRR
jgi:hypothetical protein